MPRYGGRQRRPRGESNSCRTARMIERQPARRGGWALGQRLLEVDQAAAPRCGMHPHVLGERLDQEEAAAVLTARSGPVLVDRCGVEAGPVVADVDGAEVLGDVQVHLELVRPGGVPHHVGARLGERDLQVRAVLLIDVQDVQRAPQQPADRGDAVGLSRQIEPDGHTHAPTLSRRRRRLIVTVRGIAHPGGPEKRVIHGRPARLPFRWPADRPRRRPAERRPGGRRDTPPRRWTKGRNMAEQADTATVVAARAGDPAAVDRLVAGYLPLVYTIVGRALEGHADVDDVVQDVMLRVLRNLGDLREPEAFRSWLVAITVRQVRERFRVRRGAPEALVHEDVRDPGADFTDLAITRLELSGQRRETAEATRWLDEENRELLSLWWLEAAGELTRDEIVVATEVSRQHAAVRIQRMKGQLETARVVVRALAAQPPCPDLALLVVEWDGRPGALWRKRIARHTRECRQCSPSWNGLVAAERLLAGMMLVPLPAALAGKVVITKSAIAGGAHLAGKIGFSVSGKVLTAALSTVA